MAQIPVPPTPTELRIREVQALETIGESLKMIAVAFTKMMVVVEEDVKIDQMFRKMSDLSR
jgi:hypothetical protein